MLEKPFFYGKGIGERLLSGKGFRDNHKKSSLRVEVLDHFMYMITIYIADKVNVEVIFVELQGFGNHHWS